MNHFGEHVSIKHIILTVVLLELFLSGSGRMLEFGGGVTLRMLLFAMCMLYVVGYMLVSRRISIPAEIAGFVIAFFTLIAFSVLVGVIAGMNMESILLDLKPLLYFPMILFFSLAITDVWDVRYVANLIIWCGILLSVVYLATLFMLYAGIIPFSKLYSTLNQTGEFHFRYGSPFFMYKGFLFVCVALIFLAFEKKPIKRVFAVIVFLSILLTLARGLALALALTAVIGLILGSKNKWAWGYVFVSGLLVVATVFLFEGLPQYLHNPESDSVRVADMKTVFKNLNSSNLFIGHGLGAPIGERDKIEITYLEVLYKQGLIGLLFWASVLAMVISAYARVFVDQKWLAMPFFLSVLFVFIETSTNPFLNNPIGMSVVLISIVSLHVLSRSGYYWIPPRVGNRSAS